MRHADTVPFKARKAVDRMMIDPLPAWLDKQTADVRAELNNLLAYKPEPEFVRTLAEFLPVVPGTGLVDLYYDIFYCCKPVFIMSLKQLHSSEELSRFLVIAEQALVDMADIDAFASACSDGEDIDEIIFWLKRRARLRASAM